MKIMGAYFPTTLNWLMDPVRFTFALGVFWPKTLTAKFDFSSPVSRSLNLVSIPAADSSDRSPMAQNVDKIRLKSALRTPKCSV